MTWQRRSRWERRCHVATVGETRVATVAHLIVSGVWKGNGRRHASAALLRSGPGLDAFEFGHFLGQQPQRLVELDILIDAVDSAG